MAILERGRMVETGTVEAVFSNPQTEAGRRLVFPEGPTSTSFPWRAWCGWCSTAASTSPSSPPGHRLRREGEHTGGRHPQRNGNKAFGSMLGLPEDHGEATCMSYLKAQKDVTVEEVPDYHG